ncbi:hypothetical protein BJY52DRAFT_1344987, partial [Lactarius psammicola]
MRSVPVHLVSSRTLALCMVTLTCVRARNASKVAPGGKSWMCEVRKLFITTPITSYPVSFKTSPVSSCSEITIDDLCRGN